MSIVSTKQRSRTGCEPLNDTEEQMKSIIYTILLMAISSHGLANPKPTTSEVLLDNEAVQVIRLTYPAGTESGMHTHEFPNRVVYVVRGGTLELVPADGQGKSQVLRIADGEAVYMPAVTHNVKNIGDEEIIIIETEIK
jgi:quercetin dioxygenase-like cupin family protein